MAVSLSPPSVCRLLLRLALSVVFAVYHPAATEVQQVRVPNDNCVGVSLTYNNGISGAAAHKALSGGV